MWPFKSEQERAAEAAEINRLWLERQKDPNFWPSGVPKRIEALSVEPSLNRPTGADTASFDNMDGHLRAAYAMIAQLRDRVAALEAKIAEK